MKVPLPKNKKPRHLLKKAAEKDHKDKTESPQHQKQRHIERIRPGKQVSDSHIIIGTPDRLIIFFSVAMALFGLLMVFDASVYQANNVFHNQFHFLLLHGIWLVVGLVPALIIYLWDYRKFTKLAFPALIINVILLALVLLTGEKLGGSKRWFSVAGVVPIQPAEILKPIFIMYLAVWLSKDNVFKMTLAKATSVTVELFKKKLVRFISVLGFILLLILLEPDLGTTMIIGLTAFAMFYLSSTDSVHRKGTIAVIIAFALLAVIAAVLESYRIVRIKTYFDMLITGEVTDPWGKGYQMNQVLTGIGSGGFWGKGFGQSRQKFGYLVENTAFTDSIFAIVLEELGMISGLLIIGAWLFFMWRGYKVACSADNKLGFLLAGGITIWLTLQAFMNIGANVGLIPMTGVPLPFLTYGGSSTLVTMTGIAILLNVSKYRKN